MVRDNWFHKHPIAAYLILANGITWLCWIPTLVIASKQDYLLPTIDGFAAFVQSGFSDANHLIVSVVFSLAIYGPLIGAFIVTRFDSGKVGIAELGGRIIKWRIGIRWYLAAALIALALSGVPFLLVTLTRLAQLDSSGVFALAPFILPLLLWQILTSGLGEEPGWRGFLLPKLQARFGGEKYIWVLGLIWAIWHYPFTIYHTLSSMTNVPMAAMIPTVIFTLAGFTMSIIGMTYIYVWLYNNTKSVFLAILFHAVANVANTVVLSSIEGVNPLVTLIIGIWPWAVVVVMRIVLGKERFPGYNITAT
jgi:hypothetical protein